MPTIALNDVNLHYEEAGNGTPLVFVHEFAGDTRSWEAQMRHFSRHYRCIAYNARGYPPSDVPEETARYSQDMAIADLLGVLDALGIDKAHICGLSMGSFTTLLFGFKHPDRARSLTICGSGYGAGGDKKAFIAWVDEMAARFVKEGMSTISEYARNETRIQLYNKDPRGWEEFHQQFLEHSPRGSANTLLGIQRNRPNVMDMGEEMKACQLPALIMLGDEDTPGLRGSLYMRDCLPRSGMMLFPKSGHAINLEEPELFNRTLSDFLASVENGGWPMRDPAVIAASQV